MIHLRIDSKPCVEICRSPGTSAPPRQSVGSVGLCPRSLQRRSPGASIPCRLKPPWSAFRRSNSHSDTARLTRCVRQIVQQTRVESTRQLRWGRDVAVRASAGPPFETCGHPCTPKHCPYRSRVSHTRRSHDFDFGGPRWRPAMSVWQADISELRDIPLG